MLLDVPEMLVGCLRRRWRGGWLCSSWYFEAGVVAGRKLCCGDSQPLGFKAGNKFGERGCSCVVAAGALRMLSFVLATTCVRDRCS